MVLLGGRNGPGGKKLTRGRTSLLHRVASQTHRSSEHSLSNEPQNSTTSKRILLPLESDFSQMSDPSIIIDLPSNTWIFTKLMDVIAAHLRQRAILLFAYLNDWLIRDLIRSRLVSHTIYCLQTVQSLGFIPNLNHAFNE